MRHETIMEKYSRGRRGAPAKGVGRVTGARVQIPLSPLFYFLETERLNYCNPECFIKIKKCLTKKENFITMSKLFSLREQTKSLINHQTRMNLDN